MKITCCAITAAAMAVAFNSPASASPLPANVSGYEFLLGTSCTINGQSGTCGVEFGGWTGGSGPVSNGWVRFPGTRRGLWKASVNYTGKAAFGAHVSVVSGSFDLLYTNGKTVLGNITGGTVTWPSSGASIGCGTDVAKALVNVTFTGGAAGGGLFEGCLHDLPAGSVIPPTIWGTLTLR